ncbi:red chlorophyll catabolite reductase [Micractinium conductrix]|uniref:Red chlorophyll catabolite reductase n=1 Tax=Micractinium conductrix TaxID=554055 RepID=A0A2P6V4G0_9CHLO|nr:red chlorophyll catabolite reductase [Micractinium conductrix]|eukprot:PSC68982.1 red chlorophyll catabolite reductase [Micractinium conductrix]
MAVEALGLSPAASSTAPAGLFACASADGASAAAVRAFHGDGVHWLSSSALANRAAGVGTTRLLAYTVSDRDAPHLVLEQGLFGDRVQGVVSLWPRQYWVTDLDYLHTYMAQAPVEGLRTYNETAAAAEKHPGWRAYVSPTAEVKPLLATAIAYTFPAEQAAPPPARNAAALKALDARYFGAVTSDPGNRIAVTLFGEGSTNSLLKVATGHPELNARFASSDALGLAIGSVVLTAMLVTKTWLREQQPALALLGGTHVAVMLSILFGVLVPFPRAYVHRRELFLSIIVLHAKWTCLTLSLNGAQNMWVHAGTPWRMLLVFLLQNGGAWLVLYSLHSRAVWTWTAATLALCALVSLGRSKQVCQRLFEVDGTQETLAALHFMLGLAQCAGMPQPVHMLTAATGASAWGMCLSVNAWSVLAIGVALPAFILRQLELRARRRHPGLQRGHPTADPTPGAVREPRAATLASPWGSDAPEAPLPHLLSLYLLSCLLWVGVLVAPTVGGELVMQPA